MFALILLLVAFWPQAALAHTEAAPREHPNWTFDPWLLTPLLLSALFWGVGFGRRWLRARAGQPLQAQQGLWFALAWVTLAGAVLSPLHEAGERSFTAHMIEHEIIMLIAAPLFALARPLPTMLWGFAQPWRHGIGMAAAAVTPTVRRLTGPILATALQAAVLWLWHTPSLFDLALTNEFWHTAQHVSFFASALVFWVSMLDGRIDAGARALCLFATSVITGALGAMMAFSTSPWYAPYAQLGMSPMGLTPAEDQQFAGILMWVPGGLVHAAAALTLIAPLLISHERSTADV